MPAQQSSPMRRIFSRVVALVRQQPTMAVEEASALTLKVRHGHRLTAFDRLSRTVVQNDRVVARFGVVHHVRVDRRADSDGRDAWGLALELSGGGLVEVGRSADLPSVSAAAAQIGALIGVRVVQPA
jgi:hypothetical protein